MSSLHVYPIKSAGGISVEEASLDDFGFAMDRRWMIVDSRGAMVSQREAHRLALVNVSLDRNMIQVSASDMEPLTVSGEEGNGPTIEVAVWDDRCAALDAGDVAAEWFSGFLGMPVRLVHMPGTTFRRVHPGFVPETRRVSFADAFPVLLTTEASLADLNARMETPLPMNRFRPNLVVRGTTPFEEDEWRQIQIGPVTFHVVKPCDRCVITTINQATAEQGKEPLRTLALFRKRNGQVFFGQNIVHQGPGIIRVGDRVLIGAAAP
ncbi:MAG: MOSC N-terminal beta barrel domain-containing protein [Gemmatimonadota bacterium]